MWEIKCMMIRIFLPSFQKDFFLLSPVIFSIIPFKCCFLLHSVSFQGAEATVPGTGGNEVS